MYPYFSHPRWCLNGALLSVCLLTFDRSIADIHQSCITNNGIEAGSSNILVTQAFRLESGLVERSGHHSPGRLKEFCRGFIKYTRSNGVTNSTVKFLLVSHVMKFISIYLVKSPPNHDNKILKRFSLLIKYIVEYKTIRIF